MTSLPDFDEDPRLEAILQRVMVAYHDAERQARVAMNDMTDEELDALDKLMRGKGTLGDFLANTALSTKLHRAAGEMIALTGRGVSFLEIHTWLAKKGKS